MKGAITSWVRTSERKPPKDQDVLCAFLYEYTNAPYELSFALAKFDIEEGEESWTADGEAIEEPYAWVIFSPPRKPRKKFHR